MAAVALGLAVVGSGTALAEAPAVPAGKCGESLPGSNCEPALAGSGAGAEESLPGSDLPPTAPQIGGITQIGLFLEGTPILFHVTVEDDQDAVSALSIVWTFSDGGTATGQSVVHTFAGSGRYTVRVTVTDTHGNVSFLEAPLSKPIATRLGDSPRHRGR
jgi:hypothetical protein